MSVLNKAKVTSEKVIAEAIEKATTKKSAVNEILSRKGLRCRIVDFELEMGVPPKIIFSIRDVE